MRKGFFSIALVFAALSIPVAAAPTQQNQLLLNEIVIAPPGTDSGSGCEYVELRALPGIPLPDVTYLDIEGDVEQNPGTINYLYSLQGVTPGSNGLVVIASSIACRSFAVESTVIIDPTFQSSFSNRNNGTNSFLIVNSFSGLIRGQDADVNDDGALDLAAGSVVQDSFGVRDLNNQADLVYGNVTLARPSGIPPGEAINGVSRCGNDTTVNSGAAFFYGDLDSVSNTNFYTNKPSGRSANFPAGGQLTPGEANTVCDEPTPALFLVNEVVITAPGTDRASGCEYVELRGAPGVFLSGLSYLDVDGDTSQNPGRVNYVRDLSSYSFGSNGLLVIAARDSSGNLCRTFDSGSNILEDPNFRSPGSTNNNGTNSFLLVTGTTSGLARDFDTDTDNDGTFDFAGANLTVVDGYAVRDSNASGGVTDVVYAPVLPRPSGLPAGEAINAFSRCGDDVSPLSVSAIFFGDLDAVPNTNNYRASVSSRSANFPSGGQLTPGGVNTNCGNPTP